MGTRPLGSRRGTPQTRLRIGFILIAMVLSVFGSRLVQLQAFDPDGRAAMAAAESAVDVTLPATRGEIVDRDGAPLANSVAGVMVVADPSLTRPRAPELARFLTRRLGIDYFTALEALRARGSRFEYLARRVPATRAAEVLAAADERGYEGLSSRPDPVRDYPAGDVAANLVGFLGTDEALAGFERTFDSVLAGQDGSARYEVGAGNRLPLGAATTIPAQDGADLRTTLDIDLQWFTQRVLRQTVENARAESGTAIVMDSRSGQLLAVADYPTFDANNPLLSPSEDLGSRAFSDVYEPGSVAKVLTSAALIDAGVVTPRTRLTIPAALPRQDRVIHDWFGHGRIRLTMAGVIAKSSNIGTVLAADRLGPLKLRRYFSAFGLGRPTRVGVRGESPGLLPAGSLLTPQTKDRIVFGQSMSVNAVEMTAAVNTIANDGTYVSPSLVQGRLRTDEGVEVGTETTVRRPVVSPWAAHQTMHMMERVLDPEDGVAPGAAVPGYRVAGKTGTAQRVGAECGCYDGTFTVSFAGFAPADDPRFTVYVVVQNPGIDGGGGSIAGPAFSRIMGFALRRYRVPPTGTAPSRLPVSW